MTGFQLPGDIALTDDDRHLVLTSGANLAAQQIRNGAQIFQGYWTYDDSEGVPYVESVLVKNPDLRVVQQVFREFLAECGGVSSVDSISATLDRVSRKLSVSFRVTCDDGSALADVLVLAVG